MDDRPRPLPCPVVACPWCGDPVELRAGATLRCATCRVVVDVAVSMPARPRRADRAA